MQIAILISVAISIVVAVALVPVVFQATDEVSVEEEDQYYDSVPSGSTGVDKLLDVLPYIFIAVILLGAVGFMAHSVDSNPRKKEKDK